MLDDVYSLQSVGSHLFLHADKTVRLGTVSIHAEVHGQLLGTRLSAAQSAAISDLAAGRSHSGDDGVSRRIKKWRQRGRFHSLCDRRHRPVAMAAAATLDAADRVFCHDVCGRNSAEISVRRKRAGCSTFGAGHRLLAGTGIEGLFEDLRVSSGADSQLESWFCLSFSLSVERYEMFCIPIRQPMIGGFVNFLPVVMARTFGRWASSICSRATPNGIY